MSKLPIISGKNLIKYLIDEQGFTLVRVKGSHQILKSNTIKMLPVPLYHKLDRSLLSDILTEAGITRDEFIQYWYGN